MKNKLFIFAGIILVWVFISCPSPTDGGGKPSYTVSGIVTTAGDDSAAAGARVQLKQSGKNIGEAAEADDDGSYAISGIFAGHYTIDVSFDGYEPGTISAFTVSGNVSGKDLSLKKRIAANTGESTETADGEETGGEDDADATSGASQQTDDTETGSGEAGDSGGENDADATSGASQQTDGTETGSGEAGDSGGEDDVDATSGASQQTDGTETGSGSGETGDSGTGDTGGTSTSDETGSGETGDSGGDVDVVSGASQHTGSSPIPIPAPRKTFSGGFGKVLDAVKNEPSGAYLVELTNGAARGPYNMSGFNTPVTIVIDGKGNYISLAGGYDYKGSLLRIPAGVTVILKDIEFNGCDTNTASIVIVESGGTLVMKDGAKISGARRSPVDGGAVKVRGGGVFHMDGGEISDNTGISNGGAVFISSGSFIMRGGKIIGNQASNVGAVFLFEGGEFTMEGGEISGNTSKNYAGGVLVNGGYFQMNGGVIKDNVCHLYGGGVFIGYYSHLSGTSGGVFAQKGGVISGNKAAGGGGGVSLRGSSALFILEDGEISGNQAVPDTSIDPYGGGGVFVQDGGLFECKGGKIINNVTDYELYGGGGILLASKDGGGSGGVDVVSGASGGGSLSSGSTGSNPNMILSGGYISGNTAGNGKGAGIYAESGNFTLSDAPAIHDRVCIQYQPQAAEHIFITGGFTGTTVSLDLRGNQNGITFIGNWIKPVLGMKGGGAVPDSVRSRFRLGTFTRYSTGTQNPVDISAYTIGGNGKVLAP
jgi:hypothetical protein